MNDENRLDVTCASALHCALCRDLRNFSLANGITAVSRDAPTRKQLFRNPLEIKQAVREEIEQAVREALSANGDADEAGQASQPPEAAALDTAREVMELEELEALLQSEISAVRQSLAQTRDRFARFFR